MEILKNIIVRLQLIMNMIYNELVYNGLLISLKNWILKKEELGYH